MRMPAFEYAFVIFIVNSMIQCNSETHIVAGRFSSESTGLKSSQVDNIGSGTEFTAFLTTRIGQPPPDCGRGGSGSDSGVWPTQGAESPRETLTTPGQGTRSPPIKVVATPTFITTPGPPPDPPLNLLEYLEERSDKAIPEGTLLKEEHAKLILDINSMMEVNTISPDFIHDQYAANENRLKRGNEVYIADESKEESFFVEDLFIKPSSARPTAPTNIDPIRTPYSTIDLKRVVVMKPVHSSRPRHPYPFARPLPPGFRPDTSTAASSSRPVDNSHVKPKPPYILRSPSLWDRFISLFPRLN